MMPLVPQKASYELGVRDIFLTGAPSGRDCSRCGRERRVSLVIPFERLHECAGVLSSHFSAPSRPKSASRLSTALDASQCRSRRRPRKCLIGTEPHLDFGVRKEVKLQAPHRAAIPSEISDTGFSCSVLCLVSDPVRSMANSAVTVILTDCKKKLHGRQ